MTVCDGYLIVGAILCGMIYVARLLQRRGYLSKVICGIFESYIRAKNYRQADLTLTGGLFLNLLTLEKYTELKSQLPDDSP